MKFCKSCGQILPYQHIKYDYSKKGNIKFIGKSYDDKTYEIWKVTNNHRLSQESKTGAWKDRKRLFK